MWSRNEDVLNGYNVSLDLSIVTKNYDGKMRYCRSATVAKQKLLYTPTFQEKLFSLLTIVVTILIVIVRPPAG